MEKPYIIEGVRVTREEYRKTREEDLRVRVSLGKKETFKAHAQQRGESLNAFVNRAIEETIQRDNENSLSD